MNRYFEIEETTANGKVLRFIEKHTANGCYSIPCDPTNLDYLEYVKWLFDGNTAEEWQPDAVELETTQPDMGEEV